MKKLLLTFIFFITLSIFCFAQIDSISGKENLEIFARIASSVKNFKLDTSSAPNDKMTRKIIELRQLRGGFNINEVINLKLEEELQKSKTPNEEVTKAALFFSEGDGKKWIDNATIWIYRNHYTYQELKQSVKFYKTSAGKKVSAEQPLIMMESVKAAEMIKEIYAAQQKK